MPLFVNKDSIVHSKWSHKSQNNTGFAKASPAPTTFSAHIWFFEHYTFTFVLVQAQNQRGLGHWFDKLGIKMTAIWLVEPAPIQKSRSKYESSSSRKISVVLHNQTDGYNSRNFRSSCKEADVYIAWHTLRRSSTPRNEKYTHYSGNACISLSPPADEA